MKFNREPAAVVAVVVALIGVLAIVGLPKGLAASLVALATAVGGLFVRQAVVPVPRVVEATTTAAAKAAEATASALSETTVGAVGEVTDTALNIVDGVTNLATSTALRTVGIGRKEQQAA